MAAKRTITIKGTPENQGEMRQIMDAMRPDPKEELREMLSGCSGCTYDEAEGGLIDHCELCAHKVAAWCWRNFENITVEPRKRKRSPVRNTATVTQAIGPRAQAWIMDFMLAHDRWLTVSQIAKGTGKNATTVRRGLQRLVLARFVTEDRDAVTAYKITNPKAWHELLGAE